MDEVETEIGSCSRFMSLLQSGTGTREGYLEGRVSLASCENESTLEGGARLLRRAA